MDTEEVMESDAPGPAVSDGDKAQFAASKIQSCAKGHW
jgi:hypothetical protein